MRARLRRAAGNLVVSGQLREPGCLPRVYLASLRAWKSDLRGLSLVGPCPAPPAGALASRGGHVLAACPVACRQRDPRPESERRQDSHHERRQQAPSVGAGAQHWARCSPGSTPAQKVCLRKKWPTWGAGGGSCLSIPAPSHPAAAAFPGGKPPERASSLSEVTQGWSWVQVQTRPIPKPVLLPCLPPASKGPSLQHRDGVAETQALRQGAFKNVSVPCHPPPVTDPGARGHLSSPSLPTVPRGGAPPSSHPSQAPASLRRLPAALNVSGMGL